MGDDINSHGARGFGVYLHVPFCTSKCPYCDFVSFPLDGMPAGERERLVRALHREIDLAAAAHSELSGRDVGSLYFGGGTPSSLAPVEVGDLIQHLGESFALGDAEAMEVTLECNPTSAEAAALEGFRRAGVNRISLGVQSFEPSTLQGLGRSHGVGEGRAAIDLVRGLDFASWGLDLIFGAPGSDLETWRRDLEEAISHEAPHVSVYGLTLHEGTMMHAAHDRGEVQLPDEETQREMFLLARSLLQEAGLRHYEISNYARAGHESRHNSLHWNGGEYLGLGLGAHSYFDGRRRANPASRETYLAAVEGGVFPSEAEALPSPRARRGERVMLALRQCDGFCPSDLSQELGCDFLREYSQECRTLSEQGLLLAGPDNVRLTEEGLLLSDTVFAEFF